MGLAWYPAAAKHTHRRYFHAPPHRHRARSNCSPPPLTAAPRSTAHHTGAQRLYSTVIEPAVDTNPAQHHLPSFASQFVGIGFVGRRRRGAYDFGR